jgi:hypothetical protein
MRTTWLGALAALAGIGLMISVGVGQSQGQEVEFKQVKLTEKQVQDFISAQKQIAPLQSKLEDAGDKADPALQKQVEQIAKSAGFSSLKDFGNIGSNISFVLTGLDPESGKFTEPADVIRQDMEKVKQDEQMSQKAKSEALSDMERALKATPPVQFKENIALVKKYQKELDQLLGPQEKEKK